MKLYRMYALSSRTGMAPKVTSHCFLALKGDLCLPKVSGHQWGIPHRPSISTRQIILGRDNSFFFLMIEQKGHKMPLFMLKLSVQKGEFCYPFKREIDYILHSRWSLGMELPVEKSATENRAKGHKRFNILKLFFSYFSSFFK